MRNAYIGVDPKIHGEDARVVRDVQTWSVGSGDLYLTFLEDNSLVHAVYPRGTWFHIQIHEVEE